LGARRIIRGNEWSEAMSNTAGTMRDTVRETVKDARDAVAETRGAAAAASGDLQADLAALRNDVARLTAQIGDILAAKGNKAWGRAKDNVAGVMSDATAKGQEAVDAVREVSDNMVGAIDESLKKRPYTTLAIAVGIGFLLGITRR
jgi:ElaB/YqjD/DUF883 family membrane-anchored ribosome-binding protein